MAGVGGGCAGAEGRGAVWRVVREAGKAALPALGDRAGQAEWGRCGVAGRAEPGPEGGALPRLSDACVRRHPVQDTAVIGGLGHY